MVAVIIAILGFLTIAGLGFVLTGPVADRNRTLKRAQAVTSAAGTRQGGRLRQASQTNLSAKDRRKQLLKSLQDQELTKASLDPSSLIIRAGLSITPKLFWMASGGVGLIVCVLLLMFRFSPLIALGIGFVTAAGIPRWFLNIMAQNRLKAFTALFSDALDIVVRSIRSGLPVHESLRIVAEEMPEPLSGEFRRLMENISLGMTMDAALEKTYERMPTSDLRFFTIVLAIQAKTGGNLAEALDNLSQVIRSRKMMREKIKALSSEAIASSFIIGSLPPGVVLLISVTSPHYMTVMFTDPRGHLMLGGAAIWMTLGILVMRKMINFKI